MDMCSSVARFSFNALPLTFIRKSKKYIIDTGKVQGRFTMVPSSDTSKSFKVVLPPELSQHYEDKNKVLGSGTCI